MIWWNCTQQHIHDTIWLDAAYPADEAATPAKLRLRASAARPYFLVARNSRPDGSIKIIGYVCGTLSSGNELTEESMGSHSEKGHHLLVHSVVVAAPHRKQGLATWMFRQYMRLVQTWSSRCVPVLDEHGMTCASAARPSDSRPLERASLLTKQGNVELYRRCGFVLLGPSKVVHGEDTWYDMTRSLVPPSTDLYSPRSLVTSVSEAGALARPLTQLPFLVVDAFSTPGVQTSGNPAAVVLLPPGVGVTSLEHLLARRMGELSAGKPGDLSFDSESLAWLLGDARKTARKEWSKWMQRTAIEFNLSETAFVRPFTGEESEQLLLAERAVIAAEASTGRTPGPTSTSTGTLVGKWSLRWFTPGLEVDLCGHATLASAGALWKAGSLPDAQRAVEFVSLSGQLSATRVASDVGDTIQLNFPNNPAQRSSGDTQSVSDQARTMRGLGLGSSEDSTGGSSTSGPGTGDDASKAVPLFFGRNRDDVLIEVTPKDFARIRPNIAELAKVRCRGVVVTSVGPGSRAKAAGSQEDEIDVLVSGARSGADFLSRFFGPLAGVDEDPVTGSAHTMLCPYWEGRLVGGKVSEGAAAGGSGDENGWLVGF